MKDRYQTFLAFFIPFSTALMLLWPYSQFFPDYRSYQTTNGISFDLPYESPPLEGQIFGLLICGLFILSFILPAFVDLRTDPIERTELNLTSQ